MSQDEKRETGDLIRTFGDFWLGIVGAAAKGVATFSKERRDEKRGTAPKQDFFANAAGAVRVMFNEASEVADATGEEIRGKRHSSDAEQSSHTQSGGTVTWGDGDEASRKIRTTT